MYTGHTDGPNDVIVGAGRSTIMIVDLENASQAPHITEPLMLNFNASVHYRVAMAPEELAAAGLEKYATK